MTTPGDQQNLLGADNANQNLLAPPDPPNDTTNHALALGPGFGNLPQPPLAGGPTAGQGGPAAVAAGGAGGAGGNGAVGGAVFQPPANGSPDGLVQALTGNNQNQTVEALVKALQWQGNQANSQSDFFEQLCAQSRLCVMGWVKPGSNRMQIIFGVGKVHDLDCDDMRGVLIGFVGDRDCFGGTPEAVTLPANNSWQWKKVKKDFEEATFSTFYGDVTNKDKLRTEGSDKSSFTEMLLPRLIHLPGEIGVYAAEQQRTVFEVHQFVKTVEAKYGGTITEADTALIKNYCIAASFDDGNGTDSILSLKVGPAVSGAPGFARFKGDKITGLLGPSAQQTSAAGSGPNVLTGVQQLGGHMSTLCQSVNSLITGAQSSQIQAPTLQKSSKYVEVATLKGYSHATDANGIPPIWNLLQGVTKKATIRSHIEKACWKWSEATNFDIDTELYLPNEVIGDIMALEFNASEPTQSFKKLERGLSPLVCFPRSEEETADVKERDRAEEETMGTRTITERLKLSSSDPRHPPQTLEELKLMTGTYAAICFVMTRASPLYKDLFAICTLLKTPEVRRKKTHFTPEVCARFTWLIASYARLYFSVRLHPDDFVGVGSTGKVPGKVPPFPQSNLSLILPQIQMASPMHDPTFPEKWIYVQKKRPGDSGWGWTPDMELGPTGPPSTTNNLLSSKHKAKHPKIAVLMKDFIAKFGAMNVGLTSICQSANTTIAKLPFLNKYTRPNRKGAPINGMCYIDLLGVCPRGASCNFAHATVSDLKENPDFVDALCKAVQPGVEYLVKNAPAPPNQPAAASKRRQNGW